MSKLSELSFQGRWDELLDEFRRHPETIDVASETKGYTALHQAAWHGAKPSVVGALLSLGSDRRKETFAKATAQQIAHDRHLGRKDLQYLLAPAALSLPQLLRMTAASGRDLFADYDGNRVAFDELVQITSAAQGTPTDITRSFEDALRLVFKQPLLDERAIRFSPSDAIVFEAQSQFWVCRFLPELRRSMARAWTTPISREWAVIYDLFDPAPDGWGLRGDLFLWLELRQSLCLTEIPETDEELDGTLLAALRALTGADLQRCDETYVKRFARGGMSSGMVSGQHWRDVLVPLLRERARWLREAWGVTEAS